MMRPHDNDDLWSALGEHPPKGFAVEDVVDIVAEVPGEADECDWWWILQLKQGDFFLMSGGCDYSGWG